MDMLARIEKTLESAVDRAAINAPPKLISGIRHAVFPGGARVRPQLGLAVAAACGDPEPSASNAFASAIEMMHCASLVHDDLPCFDNAETRRGRPSVHSMYGDEIAVLVGDALIVMAFEVIARGAAGVPHLIGPLVSSLSRGVGLPNGIVAGQAWESEVNVDLSTYHQQKTGALFVAATVGGAISAGQDPGPWRPLGANLGAAYQVADDLADALGSADLGKPCHQDAALARPNAVSRLGVCGAVRKLESCIDEAASSIPEGCRGRDALSALVRMQAKRLAPNDAVLKDISAA